MSQKEQLNSCGGLFHCLIRECSKYSQSCPHSCHMNSTVHAEMTKTRNQKRKKLADDLSDNTLESRLEPLHTLLTLDLVGGSDMCLASTTLGNTLTWTGHAAVEIHSIDTNSRVVLDTKIDVFADTETEVASLGEVALAEFVFLDLQSTLQDFLSLWSTDGDMYGNLLVTTDTECSDGVSGLAVDGSLTTQLFQHLRSTGKSVTRFSD